MSKKTEKTAIMKIIGINDLIKESIADYKANWKKFFWLLIIPVALSFIVSIIFDVIEKYSGVVPAYVLWPLIILSIAGFICFFVMYIWAYIAEIRLIGDYSKKVDSNSIWKWYMESRPLFWRVTAISFVYGLLAIIFSLCFIIPGVIFIIAYVFAIYGAVIDGNEFESAFGKSRNLVKGYWWAVFGRIMGGAGLMYAIYLVAVLLLMLLKVLIQGIFHVHIGEEVEKWTMDFLSMCGSLIIGPLTLIYMTKIFKALKEVKK